jgi:competence protein ComEC
LSFTCRGALYAFEMAVISATIQVGLALPMIEYFHRISFTGITANLLIVPLLNCVVPVGFAAVFTGWHWLASMAAGLLKLAARVADWHASHEPAWRVPDPPLWAALAFVAALIALAMFHTRRFLRWPAIAAVLALFAVLLWHPWGPRIEPRTLEFTAIDVGQGDSLLVVFPKGKLIVIDAGGVLQYGRARKPRIDTGEDVVSPYLWNRGFRQIDVLVVTHAHADHSGGARALIENFHPREIWTGANPSPELLECAARFHIPVLQRRVAPPFELWGATIEILSPPQDYAASKPGNNDSLAMRIAYGTRSFLLTGDMERPMEARLLDHGIVSDVLKVGHHGSKTSTMQPFLNTVSPSLAVISAGFENSFGHPNRDVLARLEQHHSAILRTDLDGLITIRTDGRRLWFDTMRSRGASAFWTPAHAFNWALAVGE